VFDDVFARPVKLSDFPVKFQFERLRRIGVIESAARSSLNAPYQIPERSSYRQVE
jgi:hypothetical protein